MVAYENFKGPAAVFTNKRLIKTNGNGDFSRLTLPWKSVDMWSVDIRNVGCSDAYLEFHTRGSHNIMFGLGKGIDLRKLNRIIAEYVL